MPGPGAEEARKENAEIVRRLQDTEAKVSTLEMEMLRLKRICDNTVKQMNQFIADQNEKQESGPPAGAKAARARILADLKAEAVKAEAVKAEAVKAEAVGVSPLPRLDDVRRMKMADLREALKSAGLKVGGKKAECVARLVGYLKNRH